MDESDLTELVGHAQQLIVDGDRAGALALYAAHWQHAVAAADHYVACVLAHFMAHAQPTATAQLEWHQHALAAADAASALHDARVVPFFPSLYANMAEVALRLGDLPQARHYSELACAVESALTDDGYGRMIRALIARVRRAAQAP